MYVTKDAGREEGVVAVVVCANLRFLLHQQRFSVRQERTFPIRIDCSVLASGQEVALLWPQAPKSLCWPQAPEVITLLALGSRSHLLTPAKAYRP